MISTFIERPLIEVIAFMEINGIRIDNDQLKNLSKEFSEKIKNIEDVIHNLADENNIGSPKQLGEILFEKTKAPKMVKREKWKFSDGCKGFRKIEK